MLKQKINVLYWYHQCTVQYNKISWMHKQATYDKEIRANPIKND